MSLELGVIAKNCREILRVSIDEFRGHTLLNLRTWFRTDSGEWRPGRQGVALRVQVLPELRAALEAATIAADPRWQDAGPEGRA